LRAIPMTAPGEPQVLRLVELPKPEITGERDVKVRLRALVAQGRKNREVASATFVTRNTVQSHVRHIFKSSAKVAYRTGRGSSLALRRHNHTAAARPSMRSEPR
jgi:hypothetical protein